MNTYDSIAKACFDTGLREQAFVPETLKERP